MGHFFEGVDGLDDVGVGGAASFVHEGDDGASVAFFDKPNGCMHDGSPGIDRARMMVHKIIVWIELF
jgi:hypothetical protein